MFQCSVCSFQSMYKYNVDRHEKVKHSKPNFTPHTINNNVTHQTGSGAEQTASFQPEDHSNLQEERVEQMYENIDQRQKAYNTIKEQYQHEEKVTTSDHDRFCTAWEDLKGERDTFANEINRRDCCGEGYLDERFAGKLRRKCL